MKSMQRTRVERLEKSLKGNMAPKTPDEISAAFVRGAYGNVADVFRRIFSARDREAHIESLRGRFPDVLIDQFKGAALQTGSENLAECMEAS